MFHGLAKSHKRKAAPAKTKRGFTLVEMIVVVGIIALVSGIAVPSLISITNSLKNSQADDYAKAIYLAAQNAVSTKLIDQPAATREALKGGGAGIPKESGSNANLSFTWNERLRYAVSGRDDAFIDSYLLLPGSVDSAIRNKKILIEFNCYTGEICSVFFLNESADATDYLTYSIVTRDDTERSKKHLGYYASSSGSSYSPPESSSVNFDNEDENEYIKYYNDGYRGSGNGELLIRIPVPDGVDQRSFASRLRVELTMQGAASGKTLTVTITDAANLNSRTERITSGLTVGSKSAVGFLFTLDSVSGSAMSFSKLVDGTGLWAGEDITFSFQVEDQTKATSFGNITSSITANPLFKSLSADTVSVANARNLQNLNEVDYRLTGSITEIQLTQNIAWGSSGTSFVPLALWNGVTFNGNGNTISGLKITAPNPNHQNYAGLFAYLGMNMKVNNLTLSSPDITLGTGVSMVGAIAGAAMSGSSVSGCSVTGLTVSVPATASLACGGLVGAMNGGTVKDCTVEGGVTNASAGAAVPTCYIGGAIGRDGGETAYTDVSAAVALTGWGGNTGELTPTTEDPSGLGVSVGKFVGSVEKGKFENCSGTGTGTADYQFLGTISVGYTPSNFDADSKYYTVTYEDWTELEKDSSVARKEENSDGSAVTYEGETTVNSITGKAIEKAGTASLGSDLPTELIKYDATLSGCHYMTNSGEERDQIIAPTDYLSYTPLAHVTGNLVQGHSYLIVSNDERYMLPASAFDETNSQTVSTVGGLDLTDYLTNGKLLSSLLLDSNVTANAVIWVGPTQSGSFESNLLFKKTTADRYLIWYYSSSGKLNNLSSAAASSSSEAFVEKYGSSSLYGVGTSLGIASFNFGYEISDDNYVFYSEANGLNTSGVTRGDLQYLAVSNGQFRIYSSWAEMESVDPYGYTKINNTQVFRLLVYDAEAEPSLTCHITSGQTITSVSTSTNTD